MKMRTNREGLFQATISEFKGQLLLVLMEYINNGRDAGAKNVRVTLNKSNKTITVSNDGTSFTAKDFANFSNFHGSHNNPEEGKVGKNCSGHASGFGLGANSLVYETKAAEEKNSTVFVLTDELFKEQLSGEAECKPQHRTPSKEFVRDIGNEGTLVTMKNVTLDRWPSGKKLGEDLAKRIGPEHMRGYKLWIDGVEAIYPIPKGATIMKSPDGTFSAVFFKAVKGDATVFGYSAIMSMISFTDLIDQQYPELSERLHPSLSSKRLGGFFQCTGLNVFRSQASDDLLKEAVVHKNSKSLTVYLRDTIEEFITLLEKHVYPTLEIMFDNKAKHKGAELLNNLAKSFSEISPLHISNDEKETEGDFDQPTEPAGPKIFQLSPKGMDVEVGKLFAINVANASGAEILWEIPNELEKQDANTTETQLWLKASKAGTYLVAACDAGSDSMATSVIAAFDTLPPKCTPNRLTLTPSGEVRQATVQNVPPNTNIRWHLENKNLLSLEIAQTGADVSIKASESSLLGKFTLVAYDENHQELGQVKGEVVQAKDKNTDKIQIGDQVYRLSSMGGGEGMPLLTDVMEERGRNKGNYPLLEVNLYHPLLAGEHTSVLDFLLPHMVMSHAKFSNLDIDDAQHILTDLQTKRLKV